MRPKGIVVVMLLALLALESGCTLFGQNAPATIGISGQERQFAGALEFLRADNEQGARVLLERVCDASPIAGVTDEALFRLAVLYLRDEGGKGVARAQAQLDRLKKEFPKSQWTHQAAPLAAHLAGMKNFRDKERELKSLRELNLSLSRDNKELRQSIERLKSLDMELEQKIKR